MLCMWYLMHNLYNKNVYILYYSVQNTYSILLHTIQVYIIYKLPMLNEKQLRCFFALTFVTVDNAVVVSWAIWEP